MSETHKRPKQTERVLDYMRRHGSISTLDAILDLGVLQLASRISELKKDGYTIKRSCLKVKNRFGEECSIFRYSLDMDKPE